jgi:hypothetical protein
MLRDKLAWKMLLLLHDPFTGKPQVAPRLLRSGLAAAELSELIISHHLGVEDDHVVVAAAHARELDQVAVLVMQTIAAQPTAHTVRSWVQALGEPVYDLLTDLAVQEGTVRRQSGGWRLTGRAPDRFPANDLIAASGPRGRLEHKLRNPAELDQPAAVLAGVLGALKLDRIIDADRPGRDRAAVRASIAAATSRLSVDLRSLIAGVEAAGDASAVVAPESPIAPTRRP